MSSVKVDTSDIIKVHVQLDESAQMFARKLTGKSLAERVELHKKALANPESAKPCASLKNKKK